MRCKVWGVVLAALLTAGSVTAQEPAEEKSADADLRTLIAEQSREIATLRRQLTEAQNQPEVRARVLRSMIANGRDSIKAACEAEKGKWAVTFTNTGSTVATMVGCVGR